MSKYILGQFALQEIQNVLIGQSGAELAAEVARLAQRFDVSRSTIYEVSASVRPKRKERTDKGKRRAVLLEDKGLRYAAEAVANHHVDPDLALEASRVEIGEATPVSLGTFRRYLREHGLNRAQQRNPVRAYRRWQASAPGEIYQFDISGVKERWLDLNTRRILHVNSLEVSKNHPNVNPGRVPLWKFVLVDDYSRFKFVRFIGVKKANSCDVIDFLLSAFRELGIPRILYSDNDAIIVSARMRRAASILDRAFAESGGFKLQQHTPGNPQATGKVEASHQMVERFEKLVGLKYQTPDLDQLNIFCDRLCERYNATANRATGDAPMLRFRAGNAAMRVPPPALLDSAFKADEFTRNIAADLTISFDGQRYQIPRKRPFVDWAGKKGCKVTIVWPPEAAFFLLVGLDGIEYEIERKLAQADAAGEFKAPEESVRQAALKELKASAASRKAAHKEAGTDLTVPGIDVPFEMPAMPRVMPRTRIETDPLLLAALAPPSAAGRPLDYWTAVELLLDQGSIDASSRDKEWVKSVFAGRAEILDTELRQALASRQPQSTVLPMQRRA
jgi:transposase